MLVAHEADLGQIIALVSSNTVVLAVWVLLQAAEVQGLLAGEAKDLRLLARVSEADSAVFEDFIFIKLCYD